MTATATRPEQCGHPPVEDPVAAALGIALQCPYPGCCSGAPWLLIPLEKNARGNVQAVDPNDYAARGRDMDVCGIVVFRRVRVRNPLGGSDFWMWTRPQTFREEP